MELLNCVELACDNDECVVLKVKDGQRMNLICLGCFDGNEIMFRLTKGYTVTCTVFTNKEDSYSWDWGLSGCTLVSNEMKRKGKMIQECIEKGLGIQCEF